MPTRRQSSGRTKSTGKHNAPGARAALRASRFGSWQELSAAVREYARAELTRLNPAFDAADFERQSLQWARPEPEEPARLWEALRKTLDSASAYLHAHPEAVRYSLYAGLLDGFLSSPIRGNAGDSLLTVRERLKHF